MISCRWTQLSGFLQTIDDLNLRAQKGRAGVKSQYHRSQTNHYIIIPSSEESLFNFPQQFPVHFHQKLNHFIPAKFYWIQLRPIWDIIPHQVEVSKSSSPAVSYRRFWTGGRLLMLLQWKKSHNNWLESRRPTNWPHINHRPSRRHCTSN